jgi:hypothetical protein
MKTRPVVVPAKPSPAGAKLRPVADADDDEDDED